MFSATAFMDLKISREIVSPSRRISAILEMMKRGLLLLFLFVAGCLEGADTLLPQSPASTNLPGSANALQLETTRNFQVKPGFRIELVASDSLTRDPVAMAFDENGRLFVLELTSRPVNGGPAVGRVRVLEDHDGNGIFHSSAVYAENIINPTVLICYAGGIFVAASGDILYLKDTTGNGIADVRREVFKSFGDATNGANGEVIITGLAWGLDNRIHAVTEGHGGDVISSSAPAQSVVLSAGGFSFDPRTFVLAAENGSGATGLSFDDRGRKFISSPVHHIEIVMYEPKYQKQNPFYTPPPADWGLPGPPATRVIYPPVRAGMGEVDPVPFSAAEGIAIYRGNTFPRDYIGDSFVADNLLGVVHHDHIVYDDIEARLERPGDEQTMEFVGSYGDLFQPTQVINAPDGNLYFTGLTRAQEPVVRPKTNAIPAAVQAPGRIYRVMPVSFKQPKIAALGKLPAEQLVLMLRHPNGWQRDTASRLLYERQDKTTVVPLIRLLFDPQAQPLARLHALCALDGIELTVAGRPTHALLESHLLKALNDPDDRVRERAVLLSERFVSKAGFWSDALWGQLVQLGNDPSPQVRWQLALTLGQGRNPGRVQTLANIVRSDPRMFLAALTSLSDGAAEMFGLMANDARIRNDPLGADGLGALVSIVGKKNQPDEIVRVLNTLQNISDAKFAFQMVLDMNEGAAQEDGSLLTGAVGDAAKPLYARASAVTADFNADATARGDALRFLATANSVDQLIASVYAREWYGLDVSLRRQALNVLLTRSEWTETLYAAMQNNLVPRSALTLEQIRFLLAHPNPEFRRPAEAFFTNWSTLQRQAVVNHYAAALQLKPDAERGHDVFSKNCEICHQTADEPDVTIFKFSLADAPKLGKQKLLALILDFNQTAQTTHPVQAFQLHNGQLLAGFVTSQTPKSIEIFDTGEYLHHIARSSIVSQTSLGFSGMPEDWETWLSTQDMADLLEYLTAGRK